MNVLLLEDDEKVAAGLRRVASMANIALFHARRVGEMEAYLRTTPMDVLVADAGLPDGDSGVDALAWARNRHPQVRRLLISVTYHETVAGSPWERFLPKPFDGPTFVTVLGELAKVASGPSPLSEGVHRPH